MIIDFPNPDEVMSEEDAQYNAGVVAANQVLDSIRQSMVGQPEIYAAGFWDTFWELFD